MKKIHLDFETRSEADLPTCGAAKYAQHPSTQVLCLAYSVEGGPTKILKRPVFKPGVTFNPVMPADLGFYVNNPEYRFIAHNAFFEECIWEYVLHQRYGWPSLMDPKRWGCTMAKAAMCGLPLSLYKCGAAIGITAQKMAILGRATLNKMSIPSKWDADGKVIWNEDPALFENMYTYCMGDVDAEKEIDARLPELPETERLIWEQDFIVNHRGIRSDVETAKKAMELASVVTDKLNRRLDQLTIGQIDKATQLQEMKHWLAGQGVVLESLDKAALRDIMARPDVSPLVKDVLYIRSQVGKSSTSKFKAIINTASDADNRVRGTLQYHGAGTGRWVGRQVQFQNLPQGTEKNPDAAIEAIQNEDHEWFQMVYPQAMETLSSCIRGVSLVAPSGKKLLCADYAGIEVAVIMWVAGEMEAIKLLASGGTLYVPMANYIYKKTDCSKYGTPAEYKVGKATVLGAGFGMWWPKFLEQCVKQGIELGSNKLTVEMTDDEETPGRKRKMTDAEVRAKQAVLSYRDLYRKVPQLWKDMELAAKLAIKNPTNSYPVAGGKIRFGMDLKREFLCMMLPSGRCLRYWKPFVKMIKTKWGADREEIHFWGEDSKTKQWSVQKTYGGSLTENAVQAIARDIMANGMINCEAAGFPIVLTVHDELIAEVDTCKKQYCGWQALEDLIKNMCRIPSWAAGMPIRAEGWVGLRYKK